MENVIDNLQIEIESSSTSASEQIKKLTTSIRKLDKLGQGTGLKALHTNLEKITTLDFSKTSRQLTEIANSLKSISGMKSLLKEMSASGDVAKEIGKKVEEKTPAAESISEKTDKGIEAPPSVSETKEKLESVTEAARETGESFSAMSEKASPATIELSSKLQAVTRLCELTKAKAQLLGVEWQQALEKFGAEDKKTIMAEIAFRNAERSAKSFEEQIEKIKEELINLNKSKFTKGLENFGNSLKRIALYRIVRTIISAIGNAVKEGLSNLIQYSEQANETMSRLKSSTLQLKNAFGTAFMPILQAVTPLIIDLCTWLSNLLNSFSALSAVISGDKTYTKAINSNLDYAASLKKVQAAQLGIDELNVIGENKNETLPNEMFETVELTGGEIASSIARITLELGALAAVLAIFKGEDIVNFFKSLGKSVKNFLKSMKDMSNVQKGVTSIALLAAEAYTCYNAFYDMFTGSKSVGEGLLTLIPICAAVGTAMYAMWGPIGVAIAAVVAVISAVVAGMKAVSEAAKDRAMEKFWKQNGIAIEDVSKMLEKYFKALGLDEQKRWNEALDETNDTLIDAIRDYDSLWESISKADTIDSSKIEQLTEAFNNLADAAMAVNKAAIGSIMSNIRVGIEMNITPELTGRLNELIGSLETAQDLINVKVNGIKAEYQKLLNEIAAGNGKITEEQRARLAELRNEINTFTLTDNTSAELWATNIKEAISQGINAGTEEEPIRTNINNLASQRDSYLDTVKTNYASSASTLRQLIELDKTQFGGALGFKDSDLDVLEQNYNAQVAQINEQFNQVIDTIIESFSAKALPAENYFHGSGFEEVMYSISAGVSGLFGWLGVRNENGETGWEYLGNKKAAQEQAEFIEELESLKGYANGGSPEDDSFFYVNPYELVGKMSNGKNAVANNEMITEGIRQATYEAMTAAYRENNGSGGTDFEVKVYLDGKQISAVVEKNQKKKGVGGSIYKGGVLNGI